tara:strand:+ start:591 stop:1460 length:870 start_codon:yes stop_codon:yes gene_type:complete
MAYLGTPPRSRVLSSADIDPGSVSLDDISFTDQPASMNISGNIDKHTMRLADKVVVNGDLDITDNLILSKISDDGNAIILTTDGSTRTIEGEGGSLEASTLSQTPNASLTGMTGEIGSVVALNGKLNTLKSSDGSATAITCDTTGRILQPAKPMFTSGCTGGNNSVSHDALIPYDEDTAGEMFDNGGNFNTSTYKFTCPVTGYYLFICQSYSNYAGSQKWCTRVKNFTSGQLISNTRIDINQDDTIVNHSISHCTVGDEIGVVNHSGGSRTYYGDGVLAQSWFGGWLVG